MKIKVLTATVIILASFCFVVAVAQDDKAQPDRWRDLVLDQATPEDANRILGRPKKDTAKGISAYPLHKRVAIQNESKDLRRLSYERVSGMKKVELIFKDNKLVLIELQPEKKISAATFPDIYGVEFIPQISEYQKDSDRPVRYPPEYYLVARTEKTYVSAEVVSDYMIYVLGGYRPSETRKTTASDDRGGFPGDVKRIQLISRTLEKREGLEVLK